MYQVYSMISMNIYKVNQSYFLLEKNYTKLKYRNELAFCIQSQGNNNNFEKLLKFFSAENHVIEIG